jgi:hypothetical protein
MKIDTYYTIFRDVAELYGWNKSSSGNLCYGNYEITYCNGELHFHHDGNQMAYPSIAIIPNSDIDAAISLLITLSKYGN